MRVEPSAHRPEQKAQPRSSFAEQLEKARARPKLPAAGKASHPSLKAAEPARVPHGAKAPRAKVGPSRLQLEAKKANHAIAQAQRAHRTFDAVLAERRAEAEVARPEVQRFAHEIALRLRGDADDAPERRAHRATQSPIPTAAVQPGATPVQIAPAPAVQERARTEALAKQIESVVERVALLSRADGPALEVALRPSEADAARVEVTRTGKGEVKVRLEARSSAERRSLASQAPAIREGLTRRGLKVKDLVIV